MKTKMDKGAKTSRGAGAAMKGFGYDIMKSGGKVKKYAKGGSCRGMGAATKGGDYKIK